MSSRIEKDLIDRSCCPSIILAIAGPWICVLGGVLVDKAIIQPLTDYIWLGSDPFDSTQQVFVAQLFTVFKSAIKSLEKYYLALALGLPCSNFLLLTNMDEIKPSSHTHLALPLKTNTDSCTRQHSMTCLIAQSLSSLFNDTTRMHIACWLLKV